jgi:transposase
MNVIAKDHRPGMPVLAGGRAVVGIDIGKRKHAATALSPKGEILAQLASFPNTCEGLDRLETELLRPAGGPGNVLAAMEATGHYWMCLHAELERRGYHTVVLNPIQTNARARTQIRKTRNDRIDSASIARLIFSGQAKATRVPDGATAELRLLTRHRRRLRAAASDMERFAHTLVDRIFPEYADVFSDPFLPSGERLIRELGLAPSTLVQQETQVRDLLRRASRNRLAPETVDQLLQAARTSIGVPQAEDIVQQQLVSVLDFRNTLRQQIKEIEQQLEQRITELQSPLLSLGIRIPLAATIHAETDPISDFRTPDQYAAYAGLDPSLHESGDTVHWRGKISKRGSPVLRQALYMAAFVVYRKHDYFHRLYRKHRRRGKHHCDVMVIIARHLARVIWRLLKDDRPFTKRPPKRKP